jgi:hypothetical protein
VVAGAAAGDEERPRPRGGFRWKAEHSSCGRRAGSVFEIVMLTGGYRSKTTLQLQTCGLWRQW